MDVVRLFSRENFQLKHECAVPWRMFAGSLGLDLLITESASDHWSPLWSWRKLAGDAPAI
jgi:hypothetical protein